MVEHSIVKDIQTSWPLQNLVISIFWEEKGLIALRFAQVYGFLLLCDFETFPSAIREQWSHLFFFLSGSLHFMIGQDYYYEVIQSLTQVIGNLIGYGVALVLTLTLGFIILLNKKANYRLFKLTKRAYTFKWLAWLAEALFFPLLINLVEFGTCKFASNKRAVTVVQCQNQLPHGYTVTLVISYGSIAIGLVYLLG